MPDSVASLSIVRRYGVALLATLLALGVRLALLPILGTDFPFITFFFAVGVAGTFGGRGPAALAIVLSALAASYWLIQPAGSISVMEVGDRWGLVVFIVMSLGIGALGFLMREAHEKARQATLEALAQRESLRATLISIGDGVIVTDDQARITVLNAVAERLTGWSTADAHGKPLEQVFVIRNESTGELVANPVAKVLATDTVMGLANHTVLLSRDGTQRPIDDSAAPIHDERGRVCGAVLVFRDVSSRRRVEQDLVENHALSQAILESSLDAIITMDHEGLIVEFNAAAERVFGYARQKAIGQRVGELIVPPQVRPQHYAGLSHYLQTGNAPLLNRRVEVEAMRADGSLIPIELVVSRITRPGPPVFTAFARDISQISRNERIRNARLAISQSLANSSQIGDAALTVLREICQVFQWQVGAWWLMESDVERLHCIRVWHGDQWQLEPLARVLHDVWLEAGDDLPARVWSTGKSQWVANLATEPTHPRNEVAIKCGLHSAFACPLVSEGKVVGVIECFTDAPREPGDDGLELLASLGAQIGSVIERRRAEEALHRVEQRIASVIDHVVDGIITIDEQGTIESVNPAVERLFGYTSPDIVGHNIKLLMPEPYHSSTNEEIAELLTRELHRIVGIGREVVGRRQDGSTFPLDLALNEFWLDDQRYVTGIVRDISERKKADDALRFLVDASTALASLADHQSTLQKVARLALPALADWCVVYLLGEGGQLTRAASAHVDPAKETWLTELAQRFPIAQLANSPAARVIESGVSQLAPEVDDAQLQALASNPEHLALLQKLEPRSHIFAPLVIREQIVGAIGFVLSDGDRRYTEADLVLAEEVARRAAVAIDNSRLYGELRDLDRRKNEFLAMLAHELRNPLAPIRNALELLTPETPAETAQWAKALMQRQVQHIVRLVDDLLDVSRVMRGKIQLKKQPLDINQAVQHAIEEAQPALETQELELSVSRLPEPIWVQADPNRLSQIISNLLTNAAKYTDKGGKVTLRVERLPEQVRIAVRDTGIGIDPSMLERIFEPFTQVTDTLDRSRGGLGIGLALVRSLVHLHHGQIRASSTGLGQGSEFTVVLPTIAAVAEEPPSEPWKPSPVPPRRVLVVDDNYGAAQTLSKLLSTFWGHTVDMAQDGPSTLTKVAEFAPDVVLLDIGLPGLTGYEVAEQLRKEPENERLLLVALTGYGAEEDRRRSLDAGFDEHLVKPASVMALQNIFLHPKLDENRELNDVS